MKRIFITGGNGFFCSRFTKRYQDEYVIKSTDKEDLDITDAQLVMASIKAFNPDIVIHAAAIASTEFCDAHPDLARKINVDGALNVAKACKSTNASLLFISTEQVFNGNTGPGPYSEETQPVPNTMYGKNKLEAEGLIREILDEVWVLRFTWQFGLPEAGCGMSPNILWNTVQNILKGEKTTVPTEEYRGMTNVKYMLNHFPNVFELPYGLYHIGSSNPLGRYDVVCEIFKALGLENRIDELLAADSDKARRDVRLSTEKLSSLGIKFPSTPEGITECIHDFGFKVQ